MVKILNGDGPKQRRVEPQALVDRVLYRREVKEGGTGEPSP